MVPIARLWFIYAFVRKAVLSLPDRGTQTASSTSSPSRAWTAPSRALHPTLTSRRCYLHLDALAYARAQLSATEGLPLSMRLLEQDPPDSCVVVLARRSCR